MNKVIISGRLTADPELRQTQSGVSACRFTVATNRKFKNDKGEFEADFITCVAWRQIAEFVSRYFTKGKMIALEGCLRSGKYQDKNYPDITHYTTEVYVDNVEFCGDKSSSTEHTAAAVPNTQPTQTAVQSQQQQQFDLSDFEEILSDGEVPF